MKSASIHKKNILNSQIVLFFLITPYFKPESLEYISSAIDQLFNIWRVISFAVVLTLYLIHGKISKIILIISAYQAVLFVSTFINEGDYWRLAVNCGAAIGFCMLTELCLFRNSKRYFTCIFWIDFVLVLINLIVLLIYPEGIAKSDYYGYSVNFLGIDNKLTVYFIPIVAVSCVYSYFKTRKLSFSSVLILLMISATVLITWSATCVVVWFIMLFYTLFIYKTKLVKLFHSVLLFIGYTVLQIGIVFLRLQAVFAFLIEDILGKSLTLSGRTDIWDLSYLLIARSPIIGYGVYEGAGLVQWNGRFWYAHNGVLEVVLQGGLLALIPFVTLFVFSAVVLYRHREHALAGIITIALFSYLILFLTEAQISSIWLFGLFVMAYHVPSLIAQADSVNPPKRTNYRFRHSIAVLKHY